MDSTFVIVEIQPEFPGGKEKLNEKLAKELKYPTYARRKGIQGRVSLEFVIGKTGLIESIKLTEGIGGGCDEEYVRAFKEVNKGKRWTPGTINGRPVKVKMRMAMIFSL